MNIKAIGTAVVITSEITKEQIQQAKNFLPEALYLMDENKVPSFVIDVASKGSISKFGINFDSFDENEKAQVTLPMPKSSVAKRKVYIKEQYGMALVNLKKLETQVVSKLASVQGTIDSALEGMEVS